MKFKDLPIGARFTTGRAGSETWWKKTPPVEHCLCTLNAISNGKQACFVPFGDDEDVILLDEAPDSVFVREAVVEKLQDALLYSRNRNIPPSQALKVSTEYILEALGLLGKEA